MTKKISSQLELNVIAEALNILIKNSNKTKGVIMNSYHLSRFQSKTHCLDYNEQLKKIKVYKKDKYYPANLSDEIFLDNQSPDNFELMMDAIVKEHNNIIKDGK